MGRATEMAHAKTIQVEPPALTPYALTAMLKEYLFAMPLHAQPRAPSTASSMGVKTPHASQIVQPTMIAIPLREHGATTPPAPIKNIKVKHVATITNAPPTTVSTAFAVNPPAPEYASRVSINSRVKITVFAAMSLLTKTPITVAPKKA